MGTSTNHFKKQDEDETVDDEIDLDEEVGIVTMANVADDGGEVVFISNSDSSDEDDDENYVDAVNDNDNDSDYNPESDTSSVKSLLVGRDDYEEDDLIKIIKKAKHVKRQQPPDILCEDITSDISFSPSSDIIAVGTMEGDVYL